jgi:TolB protein
MNRRNILFLALYAVQWLAIGLAVPAWAAMNIEIVGGTAHRIQVAVGPFLRVPLEVTDPSQVMQADLAKSGYFNLARPAGLEVGDEQAVPYGRLRAEGFDAVVVGALNPRPDGSFEVRFRLFDSVRVRQLAGLSFVAHASGLRGIGHRIADEVHKALISEPGAYGGRLAYVVKRNGRYALEVSDADGFNPVTVTESLEPLISPAWSPDGQSLAYVSFEDKKPVVYVQHLAQGKRQAVARFKGSNSAPAWSPDGRKLAVALSRDGISQIYLVDLEGGAPQRLVRSQSIDTEPAFSADGRHLYFTSDRGGSPQIYRQELESGRVERMTFGSDYCVSSALSADGRWMAFVQRVDGRFRVSVLDLQNRQTQVLTDTDHDESPSFAPNGRTLLYATLIQGRGVLATVSVNGTIRQRLTQNGNLREPAWSPAM